MRTIKPLSNQALSVFRVITEGILKVGDHRTIDNAGGNFMPVIVEGVGRSPQGALIISVAHYYEQNGDLMADPEVTFLVGIDPNGGASGYVFPLSYKQAGLGIDREYVRWEDGKIFWNLKMQNDLANFCNMWMRNIKEQQYGGKFPQVVAVG